MLEPLAELQKALVLQSPVLCRTDDTWVTVLGESKSGSSKGRFWAYIGDAEHPYSVYDFTVNRGRDGPAAFLKDFRGSSKPMPTGATTGFSLAPTPRGIVEVACWGASRVRKFDNPAGRIHARGG